jgi:hypothetical protein
MQLHGVVFTAVGYGTEDRFGNRPNPIPRMFAFFAFSALTPGFLQLSINPNLNNRGACFGALRGAELLASQRKLILTSIASVGADLVCRATSGNYRLDTAMAVGTITHASNTALARCHLSGVSSMAELLDHAVVVNGLADKTWPLAGILGRNCEQVNENGISNRNPGHPRLCRLRPCCRRPGAV